MMTPIVSQSEKLRFHTLNRKTGNRVVSQYVDSVTRKPVDETDQAKGYPRGDDDYVLLEDDEIEAVGLQSTHTIDIDSFVAKESIDRVWYDAPHYLMPREKVGEEAFCVIRQAMQNSGVAGISRLVLYRRERAVMLEPRDLGIVVWTLRYGDEVRHPQEYFAAMDAPPPDKKPLELMKQFITAHTKEWDRERIEDPVQARLLDIIAAKKKNQRPLQKRAKKGEARTDNVVNIMDALRASLDKSSREKK